MITKIENIPQELKSVNQWVCWAGIDKIPKCPYTGGNAQSNNPQTWADFATAVEACERYHFDGIGFMFAPPYFGIDLDHCIQRVDFCDEFVETLGSYAELSKSGDGIHIICRGTLPAGRRRHNGVEMYSEGRYFICTGNIYNENYRDIVDCTDTIKILHNKYLPSEAQPVTPAPRATVTNMDDVEIIDKARNCRSGYLFNMLYSGNWQGLYASQSEADLALCNQLAFWTGRNEAQMDRIFRTSGLMREKWDRRQAGTTYGALTIGKACANCREVYEPQVHADGTDLALAIFGGGEVVAKTEKKKRYDMTDTGNAQRMYDKYLDIIRYSYNRKRWYFWDGKCWRLDDSGEIKKLADVVCNDLKNEAFREQDEKTQAEMLKWAHKTASSRGKEAMIKECQHLNGIPASPDSFDAYLDYLNCQNGIVNLRNGDLMPHDGQLMLSKICNTDYDPSGARPELWMSFLDDVTAGDKALQEYIQRSVGYALTGSTKEQCAYFLYGMGNNGKSTFLDTISDMLGGYASNAQPETIMMRKWGEGGALSDIARLKSARFVTCEEPTEGVRLNEGLLKQLTGGSKITCRFLYGDEFEYTPEFKIWTATNHKPVVRGTDLGIWRRIKLIPFEVNIPKEKVDKNLKYKLRKEFPQILAWAVAGAVKWRQDGLKEPECVRVATKEYKKEMDLIAGFVEQCVVIDYDSCEKIPASDLYSIYKAWARENNEYEMSSKKFFSEVQNKLPEKGRNGRGIFYTKIRLSDYAVSMSPRQYSARDFHNN